MKTPIETDQKFTFRLEDFIYVFLLVYLVPIGALGYELSKNSDQKNAPIIITTGLILIGIALPVLLIFFSYRKRLKDRYYIEDESIIRERNGKEIFRIPFKEIISVRVNNKKGTQGSIIFFTDKSSKYYSFSYFPLNNMVPLSLYGFTRKKINLIKNRKQLLTAIYIANPNLHFID